MDLSKILSISGKSGLFRVVSQMKNAVLVESLIDKKRFPAFSHEKISSLEEIAVFTKGEDKPLKDILKAMKEKQEGKPGPDAKEDPRVLLSFFESVVPDWDQEKVYVSDIKKIISWYNLLQENDMLEFEEEKKEEETPEEPVAEAEAEKEPAAEKVKKAPKPKAAKPKKAPAKKTKKDPEE